MNRRWWLLLVVIIVGVIVWRYVWQRRCQRAEVEFKRLLWDTLLTYMPSTRSEPGAWGNAT